jgi:aminopeptidase N
MVRQMVWAALWDQVVDGNLSAKVYVQTALDNLSSEHDPFVLPQVIESVERSGLRSETAMKFIAPSAREPLYGQLEDLYLKKLRASVGGSDLQLIWFDAFANAVHTPKGLDFVAKLLKKKAALAGFKVDQEVRWTLVTALARNGYPDVAAVPGMIDAEAKADATHFGAQNRLKAMAEISTPQSKSDWMNKVVHMAQAGTPGGELSSSDLRAAMGHLNVMGQEALTEAWVQQYFDTLTQAVHSTDEEFMSSYTRELFPAVCSKKAIDLAKQALSSGLPAQAEKNLRTHVQEEERCIKARALAAS